MVIQRIITPNFCFIFSSRFRRLLQEDTKDKPSVIVPMKTVTMKQAVSQDPNDTNLVTVLMKTVTINRAVCQDPNDVKLMSCTHQNLQRLIRKHHLVYDPLLENINQISGMTLIGQQLPHHLNICWIHKWKLGRLVLLKLWSQKLHDMHPSLHFLRGYVFHQMYQNTEHIINWNISNFSDPSIVLCQTHASYGLPKLNSKVQLFCSQVT